MKLSYRLTLLLLVTVSITALANFLLTQYQKQALHNDSEKILAHTLVQSLRDALVQDVIDGNKLRVTNLLTRLSGHDNPIEYLYVTDNQHNVFAHSFEQGFPRYLIHQLEHHQDHMGIALDYKFKTNTALIYEYSEQLIPGFDTHLHIGINQSSISKKLTRHTQHILLVSIVTTLLALLIAYIWGKQLTAPLTRLSQLVRQCGTGSTVDFSVVKNTSPEIKQLASAFESASLERLQAHLALKESEQDLAITLNSIGDAVITTDDKGLVTRMNPVAEQLSGWPIEEAKGQSLKTVFPIINASTGAAIENPVDKVLNTGETVYLSNHTTLISKNKAEYQIADSAAPIRDKNNKILGVVLVFNDVTEKYQLRLERDKQLERFRELSNMALTLSGDPQSVFNNISALIGKLLDVKVVCLSELRNEQLHYLSIFDNGEIYSTTDHNDISDTPCALVKQDKDIHVYQQVTELFPNAPFLKEHNAFSYCGFPSLDSQGEVVAITCLLDDKYHEFNNDDRNLLRIFGQRISQELEYAHVQGKLMKKELQLRHSQKMDALDKLSGGIAHDYNNMLGVISGYAELLHNKLSEQPRLAKYVQQILHAGERGAKLTRKLLAFSKTKVSDAEVVELNELLLDEQHMLEKTLTLRIKLVFDLGPDLWLTFLDIGDLEDAIVNMCINAMHAMAKGGQLTIKTWNEKIDDYQANALQIKPGDYVLLSVTDTGHGIAPEIKDKIFEPFFTTKGDKGTGLGMSQVYGFTERSKSVIKVYSEPGKGTQFVFYFPRHFETDNDSNHKLNDDNNTDKLTGNENILLVDDEQALLDMGAEILIQQDYNIHCANSGKQALEILNHEAIDLIVTDVIMPEMDGYELAATIQKKYPDKKILLASGFTDERHKDLIDDELQKNLISKPYNIQALLKKIRELLDQPKRL